MRILHITKSYYPYILVMTLIGFVFRFTVFYEELTLWRNVSLSVVSFFFLILIWAFFDWVNRKLNGILPYEQSVAIRIALQISVGLLFAYLFINTLFYVNAYFYKVAEINKIVIVAGNLIWTLVVLTINGFYIGEHFFMKWKQALMRNLEVERNLAQVQFLNLQNQLNPHFLFNSLTTLNSLIHENPDLASQFLKQLASTYRYLMKHNQEKLVLLTDEIAFIEQYLSLLSTRFGESFRYQMRISSEWAGKKIVPVTLQILIENAVKHNQINTEPPFLVEIYTEEGYICVKNPKILKKRTDNSHKIGLDNLRKLYTVTAPQAAIVIEDTTSSFLVKVPLLT